MRDDRRRQRLADANPWWRPATGGQDPVAWTGYHPVLKGRPAHDLGFRAGVLDDVQSGPATDQIAVLAGPWRIGKSVALLDEARTIDAKSGQGILATKSALDTTGNIWAVRAPY
jgi:uncharacterized protein